MGTVIYSVITTPPILINVLIESIHNYPYVQFLVIVNPDSGPGNNSTADPNFASGLANLNAKSNVRTIGYVHTAWATRDSSVILHEISTYASWSNDTSGNYGIHGIFFDETPNNYTAEGESYMNLVDNYVKSHSGFGGLNYVRVLCVGRPEGYRLYIIQARSRMTVDFLQVLI